MPFLFRRNVELTIGSFEDIEAILIKDLKIQFEIKKNSDPSANQIIIKVYNLRENTKKELTEARSFYVLKVGYGEESPAVISKGEITNMQDEKNGPNRILTFFCLEGNSLETQIFNRSYLGPIPRVNILRETLNAANISTPDGIGAQLGMINKSYSAVGSLAKIVSDMVKSAKPPLQWYIDSNEFFMKLPSDLRNGYQEVTLNYENGLLSADPKVGTDKLNSGKIVGVKAVCLFHENLAVGNKLTLERTLNQVDGSYVIQSLNIRGSNRDDDFSSEIDAIPLV